MADISSDIFFASISEISAKLRAKEFSCVELTRAYCDRFERLAPRYNALALSLRDQAMAQAREVDSELKRGRTRGPLQGVPYGVKDLIAVKNQPTAWGARPFAGQVFVTDQSHSFLMRCFLERVDGLLQGACFPFREGFGSGSLAVQFAPHASLYVGGTNRGWGSRGGGDYALERLVWTGKTPFEIRSIAARPDGFELEFTAPVDRATAADPASYRARGFGYIFQSAYGSPVVDDEPCPVVEAVPDDSGRRVRLVLGNLRAGVIHEIACPGVRSAGADGIPAGVPLLHDTGWYTLNRIPR